VPRPSEILVNKFPFPPTPGQQRFFNLLDDFLENPDLKNPILILKGYAGTGKTTLIKTLVQVLPFFNYRFLLMAPTGRASKVISLRSGKKAYTIHKRIYKQVADRESGRLLFEKQKSYYENTVFVVDEASMLAHNVHSGNDLLQDLLEFAFNKPENKLLLIGDIAQLPPVGQEESYALQKRYLQERFHYPVLECELTEVLRHKTSSGILSNATSLRQQFSGKQVSIKFKTKGYGDIYRMTGEKLEDGLRYAYDKYGQEESVIICRSNRMAVRYNEYIRRSIHFYDSEVEAGDFLMIVRNNYFFAEKTMGFLANGDFVEIVKIKKFEERHGFRFAWMLLRLVDYPEDEPFEANVMLGTLHSEDTSLSLEDYKKLYGSAQQDYMDMSSKKERSRALQNDPYLNALQVKFAYALTCHKSQGGQWDAVFVDQGYLKEDMIDHQYLRWLYTAVTRAKEELYLVNFNPNFF